MRTGVYPAAINDLQPTEDESQRTRFAAEAIKRLLARIPTERII